MSYHIKMNANYMQEMSIVTTKKARSHMWQRERNYVIFGMNLGLVRMLSPYLSKKNDVGAKASAIKPRRVFPQPRPSVSYKGVPANGIVAPKTHRKASSAETALAA